MKSIPLTAADRQVYSRRLAAAGNLLTGLLKIILALLSRSLSLLIYALYNIGMGLAKGSSVAPGEQWANHRRCGAIVLAASLCYMAYSGYLLLHGVQAKYHMYAAIGIAFLSFYSVSMAVIGIRKAKKENNLQNKTVKLTNLASALISLSLTQTAILSFTNDADMSRYDAFCGLSFGLAAALIGLFMVREGQNKGNL